MTSRTKSTLTLLLTLVLLLTACSAQTTPEVVKETVVVMETVVVEGTPQVIEKVVTPVSEEPVTLLVWDQFGEPGTTTAVDLIYEKFMNTYPHITIEREIVPADQLEATARTALAAGAGGPDVLYHDIVPTKELIKAGLILPLDEYAEQYGWRDYFYEQGLSWTDFDDHLWGIGLESEFVGVFYNKTLFDKEGWAVPQTYSEVLEVCRAAKEKGYVPLAHSQNPGWQNYFSFSMPVYNYLGAGYLFNIYDSGGQWDTAEMAAAVNTVYKDMKEAGCFIDDLNGLSYEGAIDLFNNQQALMLPTGTWVLDRIAPLTESAEVGLMPWFDMEKGQPRYYTMGMGSAYFIPASSSHPDEAALFLDFIFSPDAVEVWIEGANRIPPVPVEKELDVSPLMQFVLDTLESAGSGGGDLEIVRDVYISVPEAFNKVLEADLQALFAGTETTEEVLAKLQEAWENK